MKFVDDTSTINSLVKVVNDYEKHFLKLFEKQKIIGLNPKDGLYGQLRSAVHNVEKNIGNKDYKLLSEMLQLRRNEKDFMLRLDEKYATRLQNNASLMKSDVESSSSLSASDKKQIMDGIIAYQTAFEELVKAQSRVRA